MNADPLSDTLALADARCAISGGFTAGGAWALRFPRPNRLKIHAVVKGRCWLALDGIERGALLEAGDVAIFDGSYPFVLASEPAVEPIDAVRLFAEAPGRVVRLGDGDEHVSVGGHIDLSQAGEELLRQALPPLIHVRAGADEAAELRWLLGQLLREMEAGRAGASFAADQLAQLLFVQVLRAYLADSASLPAG